MPKSLINPSILTRLDDIRADFINGKPFRHVVLDDFLISDVAEQMLATFPTVTDPSKLLNEFGEPNPKSAISDVRTLAAPYLTMDDYIQSREFLDTMSHITEIPDLRYDPWYYGAGTHENFHGAGLDAHYDFNIHPHTAYHRRLNAIVYLNKDWDPAWNGDISFHTDPWDLKNDIKKSIQPAFNRCVIFETTENSWHSVTPVKMPEHLRHVGRKSFTIYLYTDSRPPEETAPEHGTVYVHPPLPDHIREGRTLDADDMAEINLNLNRRHAYLKNMYKREYRFARVIDDLKRQTAEAKAASYVPVIGRAKVKTVSQPLFADGWMGSGLSFTLELRQDVREMVANTWLSDTNTDPLDLHFATDGRATTQTVVSGMTQVRLEVAASAGETLEISLSSSKTRRSSDVDDRQVSVILDSIELN